MADKAVVTQSTLDAIGQAIISKGGATAPMTPAQMATAISNIKLGIQIEGLINGDKYDINYDGTNEIKHDLFRNWNIGIISLSRATQISYNAFQESPFDSLDAPNVTFVNNNALRGDGTSVVAESINLPSVSRVGNNICYSRLFRNAVFGNVKNWSAVGAFYKAYKTESISFPELVSFNNGKSWADGLGDSNESADGMCHLFMPKMNHSTVLSYTTMLSTCGKKCVFHCAEMDVMFVEGAWVAVERS